MKRWTRRLCSMMILTSMHTMVSERSNVSINSGELWELNDSKIAGVALFTLSEGMLKYDKTVLCPVLVFVVRSAFQHRDLSYVEVMFLDQVRLVNDDWFYVNGRRIA